MNIERFELIDDDTNNPINNHKKINPTKKSFSTSLMFIKKLFCQNNAITKL